MVNQRKAYLYAIAVILIWSTVASAFKISLRYLDFIQLLFFASSVSLFVLFIVLVSQGKLMLLRTYSKKDYLLSGLLGFLNPCLYYAVLFKAYSLLPAQEAQPLNQTWAIVLALLAIIVLRQRITLKNIIALVISFVGVVIISTHGHVFSLKFSNVTGAILAVASAFIWALFWLYNLKDRRDVVAKLFLNFLFGTLFIIIIVLVTKVSLKPTLAGFAGAAYVGIFEMGITFVLWFNALRLSKTTAQVSNMIYLVPFLSLVIIHFAIGEKILTSTIIGLIFIIAGILLQKSKANHTLLKR